MGRGKQGICAESRMATGSFDRGCLTRIGVAEGVWAGDSQLCLFGAAEGLWIETARTGLGEKGKERKKGEGGGGRREGGVGGGGGQRGPSVGEGGGGRSGPGPGLRALPLRRA